MKKKEKLEAIDSGVNALAMKNRTTASLEEKVFFLFFLFSYLKNKSCIGT